MAPTPIEWLCAELASGRTDPLAIVADALRRANSNYGHNVYLEHHPAKVLSEAEALAVRFASTSAQDLPPLFGVPVAIKDCFAMKGFHTSCGSRFYRELHGVAQEDSTVLQRVRRAGAVITGKAHLHQLAYGITGENQDYGDCVQPGNDGALTGGSSSGAAASVMEGSALAAIGTDTGGSIRVPAALCGLAGYRASLGIGGEETWRGGYHLAPSFDTVGWLFRDLRDGPRLAQVLLGIEPQPEATRKVQIAMVGADFLHDCEPPVLQVFKTWQQRLREAGAEIALFDTDFWSGAMEIFAGIQAHEAALLHRGYFDQFESTIAERLTWGESIPRRELERLRAAHLQFRGQMDHLLGRFDFMIAPCAPMSTLQAGADHSLTRRTILRYTIPASLSGNPVVALPGEGGGVQLIAARGADAKLLTFAARLGKNLALQKETRC